MIDDLEKTIADLVVRKNDAPFDNAERAFYERQLRALRYSREEAGGIIEEYDPMGWGGPCCPLPDRECPAGTVVPLRKTKRPPG